jgi:REP element-mobilizing transposase RayT
MVLAYHLIITSYGLWLPNDPRGSWSDFVRAWDLFLAGGPATRTHERRSLARDPHDVRQRLEVKKHLSHPEVRFSGVQARAIARGFASYIGRSKLVVHACSILPQHVHLVIARHTCSIEQAANLLKGAATTELLREGLHPFKNAPYNNGKLPTPWARKQWSVFLSSDDEIDRAIAYVQKNLLKDGFKRQDWSFLTVLEQADLRSRR